MERRTDLQLEQRQRLHLTQAQLRYVRMLEMNSQEVESAVENELEENPALEAVDGESSGTSVSVDTTPYYRLHVSNRSADDALPDFSPADNAESMYDVLNRQLGERELTPEVRSVASYIIGSLDGNGYLRRSLQQISDDIAFSTGELVDDSIVEEGFRVVRDLEPRGICATDLRDCLLLQLDALPPSEEVVIARRILQEQYEAFTMKHIHKIVSGLHIPIEEARKGVALILTLNPKPGAALGGVDEGSAPVVPDFIVSNEDGVLSVMLANRLPELRIEESFRDAVKRMEQNKEKRKRESRERKFITTHYSEARSFIGILRQRQETLYSVMAAIVAIQRDYFETGDVARLRGMTIKDVAERTGYDISVISRATANKYVMTGGGIFPLRYFFSNGLGNDGEEFTNRQVEEEMKKVVDGEDKRHPLSDERLREILEGRGYSISRRTVAKYRDRLGIPVARLRKELG